MKYEDSSIHIGNKNKIENSVIGKCEQINNAKNAKSDKSEKWYTKLFWKLIIPIAVVVVAAVICLWLGLK